MLSPKEWSALVQHGCSADVRAALGNGEATREVANSCIDYIDPCSGMLGNDLDAWVRRPAIVYAVSAGKLELFKVLLGSHLVDPNETSAADQCPSVARAAAFSSRLAGHGGVISRCAYSADFLVEILKHPLLDVNSSDDEGSTALCVFISPAGAGYTTADRGWRWRRIACALKLLAALCLPLCSAVACAHFSRPLRHAAAYARMTRP